MSADDKFIAFIDIIGFKDLVERSEAGDGPPLSEIRNIVSLLGSEENRKRIEEDGPFICPRSKKVRKDLDFKITRVSDCAVVSAEISPAGAMHVIQHCWAAAMRLLTKGVMVRGYVTRGLIYHEGTEFIGTGYQKAVEKEKAVAAFREDANERGTPFIEIDPEVCLYINTETDDCIREMFSRSVKGDGEVMAIFPFQALSHSFAIGSLFGAPFDAAQELKSNAVVRGWIADFKIKVLQHVASDNARASAKAKHYLRALDAQLLVCDRTEEIIRSLTGSRFPR